MRTVEQFLERVDVNGPVAYPGLSPCWLWLGSRLRRNGRLHYGKLSVDGKKVYAHRVSYELHVGPIPEGAHVLHSCDVEHCVNPEHLRLGTHNENMLDIGLRRRRTNKLSDAQVLAIRAATCSQNALARHYGVAHRTISKILQRVTFKYL